MWTRHFVYYKCRPRIRCTTYTVPAFFLRKCCLTLCSPRWIMNTIHITQGVTPCCMNPWHFVPSPLLLVPQHLVTDTICQELSLIVKWIFILSHRHNFSIELSLICQCILWQTHLLISRKLSPFCRCFFATSCDKQFSNKSIIVNGAVSYDIDTILNRVISHSSKLQHPVTDAIFQQSQCFWLASGE